MTGNPDQLSGHRQVSGLLLPLLTLLVVLGLGSAGVLLRSTVTLAAILPWLLVFWLLLGVRRSLTLRSRALQPAEPAEGEEPPAPTTRSPSMATLRLAGGLTVSAGGLLLVLLPPQECSATQGVALGIAAVLLLLCFGALVLVRYFEATPLEQLPDARGLAAMFRVTTWMSLVGVLALVARSLGRHSWETQFSTLLAALGILLGLELALRGLVAPGFRRPANGSFGADLFTARLLGSAFNPITSLFLALERSSGVAVRSSWALLFLRRALVPMLAGLAALAWLLSCVTVVGPSQQAVRERFGRPLSAEPLGPGLKIGFPWPMDRVRRVDVHRVRDMPIGYVEAKAGAAALWTQYHAAEEYNLLLGNGRDLVTVNGELHYRVGDIHEWLYGVQNPVEALDTLAYRVLMDLTTDRSLDQVLSENVAAFSQQVATDVQAEADRHDLGIEVVAFSLRGLHPPVAVAADYQSVVSAQIDKVTYVMQAQAYRMGALPKAEAEAVRIQNRALAEQATRLAEARGEAIAFRTLEAQYRASPSLYRFRSRLESLEEALKDRRFTVLDDRIERDGGALWLVE